MGNPNSLEINFAAVPLPDDGGPRKHATHKSLFSVGDCLICVFITTLSDFFRLLFQSPDGKHAAVVHIGTRGSD